MKTQSYYLKCEKLGINRCVLIVGKEDADKIISFLNENNAEVFVREIILKKSDIENLK